MLAHVDAGKTTLIESLLFRTGAVRKLGSVDAGDSHLDFNELEQRRGITIYAKQAMVEFGDAELTLIDTPGHVDFSSEAERTLQVLDYAVLVVDTNSGVRGHTETLWRLLKQRGMGSLSLEFHGYEPCHNAQEVIEAAAYDPEADLANTPDSVFCSHGAGRTVKWDEVAEAAHVKPNPATFTAWREATPEFFGNLK